MPSLLNDPNPVDVILLSHQLFSSDHQFVQVVHDAEGRADSDAEVPGKGVRPGGNAIGMVEEHLHVLFILQKVDSRRLREPVFITFLAWDDVKPVSEPQESI